MAEHNYCKFNQLTPVLFYPSVTRFFDAELLNSEEQYKRQGSAYIVRNDEIQVKYRCGACT